ncbi:MAG TPA: hypothetical protein VKA68_06530, partial [bacterium]|nr:hypothetical protein [bacterium]
MRLNSNTYRLKDEDDLGRRALIAGVAGLVLSAFGLLFNTERFFYSYLTAAVFWITIAVGALFFVMLHHLVSAKWSVVVR